MNRKMARVLIAGWLFVFGIGMAFAEGQGGLSPKFASLFVATDRHAQYETTATAGEAEPLNPSEMPAGPEEKKNGPSRERWKKMPLFDANGELIWHNNLTDVLTLVARDEDAVQPEMVLLGGDNVGEGGDGGRDATGYPIGAPVFSMRGVDAQISHAFGESVRGLYTYGSHDTNETGVYEDVFFSGPVQGNGYWVYGISYAQMIYHSDRQALTEDGRGKIYSGKDLADPNGISAETAGNRFRSWVKSLDDHWPIIVLSHVPLHARRGDNSGAKFWTQALNEAAENHDIVFLWGHNHTVEGGKNDKASEQANYLLLPGETITVQSWEEDADGKIITKRKISAPEGEQAEKAEDEKRDSSEGRPKYELIVEQEPLSFIYMNAGYLIKGVGSLLTFTDAESDGIWDSLTVKRYLLDEETEDPIRERSGDEALQLPLRAWDEPLIR